MTGREQRRLALLYIISTIEEELGALNQDELLDIETGKALDPEDARGAKRVIEEVLVTMRRRASRLRSVR
jgi:hypothetical protein